MELTLQTISEILTKHYANPQHLSEDVPEVYKVINSLDADLRSRLMHFGKLVRATIIESLGGRSELDDQYCDATQDLLEGVIEEKEFNFGDFTFRMNKTESSKYEVRLIDKESVLYLQDDETQLDFWDNMWQPLEEIIDRIICTNVKDVDTDFTHTAALVIMKALS